MIVSEKRTVKITDPEIFMHEEDKKALQALKKIPLFDKICSKVIEVFNESYMKIIDMSSKIRINSEQLPRIYNMVVDICRKLSIDIPDLYLELNREPNAYTYGDKKATITITSGLLECMNDDELYAVLAHECGHIACKHVLYKKIGSIILDTSLFGAGMLTGNSFLVSAISLPLKIAFYYWMRCSEFSADRAATVCCGDSECVVRTMMRLAGGTVHFNDEIDIDLFVKQAQDYEDIADENLWNKTLEFYALHKSSHPLLSVRASESRRWCASDDFAKIMS